MKRRFWTKKKRFEKCNMTSISLEETLEYLKIQRSEKHTAYYLCKGKFLYVFLYPEIYYTGTK